MLGTVDPETFGVTGTGHSSVCPGRWCRRSTSRATPVDDVVGARFGSCCETGFRCFVRATSDLWAPGCRRTFADAQFPLRRGIGRTGDLPRAVSAGTDGAIDDLDEITFGAQPPYVACRRPPCDPETAPERHVARRPPHRCQNGHWQSRRGVGRLPSFQPTSAAKLRKNSASYARSGVCRTRSSMRWASAPTRIRQRSAWTPSRMTLAAAAAVSAPPRGSCGRVRPPRLNVLIRHGRGIDAGGGDWRGSARFHFVQPVGWLCTLRELETIEVPIWPGITTEHLMCGAFRRRSLIRASVNPLPQILLHCRTITKRPAQPWPGTH